MSSQNENYVFLGLHGSGKTTYFVLMAKYLQERGNDTKLYKFRYLPALSPSNEGGSVDSNANAVGTESPDVAAHDSESREGPSTSDYIAEQIERVENQEWPDKTVTFAGEYRCELQRNRRILGHNIPHVEKTVTISYSDFTGDAFESSFGRKNGNIKESEDGEICDGIEKAKGIFLIIDAEQMFNKARSNELNQMLSKLITKINGQKKKLAIVFSKVDLFFGVEFFADKEILKNIFTETYGNAFAHLDEKLVSYEFFPVKSFTKIDIPDDGSNPRPPTDYEFDESLLGPIEWMTGFKLKEDHIPKK